MHVAALAVAYKTETKKSMKVSVYPNPNPNRNKAKRNPNYDPQEAYKGGMLSYIKAELKDDLIVMGTVPQG